MKSLLAIMAFSGLCAYSLVEEQSRSENSKMSDIMLQNIEALTYGEDEPSISCVGDGCLDCPLGGKAKYIITGLSLK